MGKDVPHNITQPYLVALYLEAYRMTPAHFLTLTARPEKLARVMAEVNARPGHAYGQGAPWVPRRGY